MIEISLEPKKQNDIIPWQHRRGEIRTCTVLLSFWGHHHHHHQLQRSLYQLLGGQLPWDISLHSSRPSPSPRSSSARIDKFIGSVVAFSTTRLVDMKFPGGCYCNKIRYEIELEDAGKARTSICHCKNCKVCITFTHWPSLGTMIPSTYRLLFFGWLVPKRRRNSREVLLV